MGFALRESRLFLWRAAQPVAGVKGRLFQAGHAYPSAGGRRGQKQCLAGGNGDGGEKAPDLKTGDVQASVGSNPTPSAIRLFVLIRRLH